MNRYVEILLLTLKYFSPVREVKNPVMFVTEISTVVALFITIFPSAFNLPSTSTYLQFYMAVVILLFLTVFFSNLSWAISEGKSQAIAASLQKFKKETTAHLKKGEILVDVKSTDLIKDDIVVVNKNEAIPMDGEIIEGSGYVNESNITGESRPSLKVLGDSVTATTTLVTDHIIIKVTSNPGETFIDQMIKIVASARREKTPNEIALTTFLSGITLVFLIVAALIFSMGYFFLNPIDIMIIIVLLIALIPTTIGGLLPAIGVAAINKVSEFNIIAKSGRAVENAGDIDTIILDKTGTVTMGEREATKFYPNSGVDYTEFQRMCLLSSLQDQTKEGMSIVKLAKRENQNLPDTLEGYRFEPFSAETRYSGIFKGDEYVVKGALKTLKSKYSLQDTFIEALCKEISSRGGTALPVVSNGKFVGVIELNDMLKPGIRERLSSLKSMNIKTIMCTGDDEVTASYISAESGIDEYIANSTPMDKYEVVLKEKGKQRMVAMVGDGTNDAPALSRADVGLAMNNGTQSAKEAANMIDLDSDPTKLMDVIFIGKQILITRGALTTFSIANDISKYFVIIPAMFFFVPQLAFINILDLQNPILAITAALIFNTIVIPFLIPLALRGVRFKPSSLNSLLKRNLLIYGLGGVILPFIAIKIIYIALSAGGVVW
ncbi:MAG: potassium-transporting ATPase subunit KdpB [Thermoplasmataceae archaeon]